MGPAWRGGVVHGGTPWVVLLGGMMLSGCEPTVTFPVQHVAEVGVESCTMHSQDPAAGHVDNLSIRANFYLQDLDVEDGDLRGLYARRIRIRVDSPPGSDLSYIKQMLVWVAAPGQPETMVAQQSSFAPGRDDVDLEIQPINLAPLVTGQSMRLTLETRLRDCPAKDQDLRVESSFDVEATPRGAFKAVQLLSVTQ